jgi:hypothetical protein
LTLHVIGWSLEGPLKLGRSIDPQARVAAIQPGSPWPLRVVAVATIHRRFYNKHWTAAAIERTLRKQLAPRRLRGDWFDIGVAELSALIPPIPGKDGHVTWLVASESPAQSTS